MNDSNALQSPINLHHVPKKHMSKITKKYQARANHKIRAKSNIPTITSTFHHTKIRVNHPEKPTKKCLQG